MVHAAMGRIQQVLNYQVSIAALVEVAFWLAIPYLCIGLAWTVMHPDQTRQMQTRLEAVSPVGADVGAFGLMTVLWPASLQIANACPAP